MSAAGPPVEKSFGQKCAAGVFTYRTTKMVKVYDKKLVTVFQAFTSLGYVYAIFFLVVQRSYMFTNTPNMSINLQVENTNITDPTYLQNSMGVPGNVPYYCNTSATYYNHSLPLRLYDQAQCVGYYMPGEYSSITGGSLWVYTYFMQRFVDRVCENDGDTAPLPNASFPFYMTMPSNCTSVLKAKGGVFLYKAEDVMVTITPNYITSWQATGKLTKFDVVDIYGKALEGPQYTSTTGSLALTVSDMLTLAGSSLDALNPNSGGYGPSDVQSGNRAWPPYRLTGLQLVATVSITNIYTANPGNFNYTAKIAFDLTSTGSWHQPNPLLILQGETANAATGAHLLDLAYTTREWSGLEVQFVASGRVGRPDVFAAIAALLNVFVIMMFVGAMVDFMGLQLSMDFHREKFDDDGERSLITSTLEKIADHGVPFNFEDLRLRLASGDLGESYEAAIFRLEREVEEVRFGNDKVRAAAKLLAAEVALDGEEILQEKVEPPEPIMKLMSPDGYDEIPLFAGDNAVGRGLGLCKHPTVSRKQMVITIDAETQKGYARSCRGEKANSVPGVKRGDNPWRLLTERGQTLSQGDRVAMQYKKVGQKEDLINEYLYVPLDQAPEVRPTLWGSLMKAATGAG